MVICVLGAYVRETPLRVTPERGDDSVVKCLLSSEFRMVRESPWTDGPLSVVLVWGVEMIGTIAPYSKHA